MQLHHIISKLHNSGLYQIGPNAREFQSIIAHGPFDGIESGSVRITNTPDSRSRVGGDRRKRGRRGNE